MVSESTFLSLPREVRDEIYGHYVRTDCGYVCNSETLIARTLNINSSGSTDGNLGIIAGVLERADGHPIDLGLSLTCKLVADEMRGVALRKNTITFSTATSEELRIVALQFDILIKAVDSSQEYLFHRAGYTIPQIARDRLKLAYPQLAPLLEDLKEEYELADTLKRRGPFGEAPSRYRAFCKEALAASSIPDVPEVSERHYTWADPTRTGLDSEPHDALRVAKCSVHHWAIPSEEVLNDLASGLDIDTNARLAGAMTTKDRSNYRFSAAAAAVCFLQSMPEGMQGHLRRIILDEDREAVAKPQCHALGLISFCKQNPGLRIERRVNLWRNALLADSNFNTPYTRHQAKFRTMTRREPVPWGVEDKQVTANVSQWVMEALALASAGMPPASFALVLDGQPAPQLCTEIFQTTIQRDVAWQAAWLASVDQGIVPPTEWFLTRLVVFNKLRVARRTGYFYRGFPRAMRDIVQGTSIVRCNFDPGELWNVDRIVQDHRAWTPQQWQEAWADHEPKTWFPVAPLPYFKALLEEDLVPRCGKKEKLSRSRRSRGTAHEGGHVAPAPRQQGAGNGENLILRWWVHRNHALKVIKENLGLRLVLNVVISVNLGWCCSLSTAEGSPSCDQRSRALVSTSRLMSKLSGHMTVNQCCVKINKDCHSQQLYDYPFFQKM